MAAKKAGKKTTPIDYPKGASKRSQNAASSRMEKEARAIGRKEFSKRMYDYIKSEGLEKKFTSYAGIGEGGSFASTGLDRKRDEARAKELAARTKDASNKMKQGVTKSGGYSADMWTNRSLQDLRGAKSSKFKAEQAVKKAGGSMTRNAGNKKRNAK
jgi:hypothetical protein